MIIESENAKNRFRKNIQCGRFFCAHTHIIITYIIIIWGATAPRPPQYKNRPVKQETTSRAVSTYKYNYFDNLEFGHILLLYIIYI